MSTRLSCTPFSRATPSPGCLLAPEFNSVASTRSPAETVSMGSERASTAARAAGRVDRSPRSTCWWRRGRAPALRSSIFSALEVARASTNRHPSRDARAHCEHSRRNTHADTAPPAQASARAAAAVASSGPKAAYPSPPRSPPPTAGPTTSCAGRVTRGLRPPLPPRAAPLAGPPSAGRVPAGFLAASDQSSTAARSRTRGSPRRSRSSRSPAAPHAAPF
mmetsp:Transcript_45543/g.102847  ORF Transcript_45543/g.102847 Transcript_45543/m.102847 type:complete len:220 (+) Transcript_45543:229-888(+)